MDLGFFLSHVMLKAARKAAIREQYFELTHAFWAAMAKSCVFDHLRLWNSAASSTLPFVPLRASMARAPSITCRRNRSAKAVRRLARRILKEGLARWEDVLVRAEACYAALC